MSLVQCPECSSKVSSKALMCLSCGFPISKSKALSVAILLKDSQMISDLMQLGADVNSADEHGQTPLMIASANGDRKIVDMLLQAGASASEQIARPAEPPTVSEPEPPVDVADQGATSMHPSLHEDEFIEDEELPERLEYQDGLTCLQCGGGITPDEMNCSHCKTLIMRRYCSHCSKLIPDHATVCPLCNQNVKEHFLYTKLRRAKILIAVGTAAIFILVPLILIWQQSASKTTPVQANAISKPEIPDAKSTDPEIEQEEISLPEPPEVQEIAPLPATIKPKFEPPHEIQKPIKTLRAEEHVESKVEPPQPKTPELAKVEEPRPNATFSAAEQRALELHSQQRVRKGRFLNNKGYSLIKEGRPSDAIPLLVQSVRSFPEGTRDVTYAYALFNLAVAYRMAGRPDIAIPILKERIKINNQRDVVERELLAAKRQARKSGLSESELD